MRSFTSPGLVWAALGCIAAVVVTALAFSLGTGAGVDAFPIAMLPFPLVGALIASRHPNNALG